VFGGDLEFTAIFVNSDTAADDYLQAVGGAETQQARRRTEHHDANLGRPFFERAIFESEIKMTGIGGAVVGDLAFHPGVRIFALDVGTDRGDEVADFPDAALGRPEAEAHLVGDRGHTGSVTQVGFLLPTRKSPLLAQSAREKWGTLEAIILPL